MSLREAEIYYLRLLLENMKRAISYKYIETVDREKCARFREACTQSEQVIVDMEWKNAIIEAFHLNLFGLQNYLQLS